MVEAVELGPEHADEVLALYRDHEWWADRERDDVRAALDHGLAVGLRTEGGQLVASARILTDFTYYAKVYDVVVALDCRGEGIGQELMSAVVDHPDIAGLNLELTCREGLGPFYADRGFEEYDLTVEVDDTEEPFVTMMY